MKTQIPPFVVPPVFRLHFDQLANAQRGYPEARMNDIQEAQISAVYAFIAEHVGDLTHRMSENTDFPSSAAGYGYVKEKVEKTLRELRHHKQYTPCGFLGEVRRQIGSNFLHYQSAEGQPYRREVHSSPENMERVLCELGHAYAKAHRILPVFNSAQRHARDAAVAVGLWDFDAVIYHLEVLEKRLKRGWRHWTRYAWDISELGG